MFLYFYDSLAKESTKNGVTGRTVEIKERKTERGSFVLKSYF